MFKFNYRTLDKRNFNEIYISYQVKILKGIVQET